MITKTKLEIYCKYLGDIDAFARIGTSQEKSIITDDEWMLIDELIQDMELIEKKLVSNKMKETINYNINANLADDTSKDILIQIVKNKF